MAENSVPQENSIQLNQIAVEPETIAESKIDFGNIDAYSGKPDYYKKYDVATIKEAEKRVKEINDEIKKKNLKWTAGVTDIGLYYTAHPERIPRASDISESDLGENVSAQTPGVLESFSPETMPTYFDWRNAEFNGSDWISSGINGKDWMTSVKNQRGCNSCYAFSSVGGVEAKYNIFNNNFDLDLDLSEQDLMCIMGKSCSSLGLETMALNRLRDSGVVNESCLIYEYDCSSKCSSSDIYNIQDYFITIDHEDTGWNNNSEIYKQALFDYGPLIIRPCIDIYEFSVFSNANLVYAPTPTCSFDHHSFDHSLVLVGYNDTGDYDPTHLDVSYWIVKNSWGTDSWNGVGYGKIAFGYVESGAFALAVLNTSDVCVDRDADGVNETSRLIDSNGNMFCGSVDCDDGNNSKWMNMNLFFDNDYDGYGNKSSVSFCGNGTISLGYADNDGDCDDTNEGVNPQACFLLSSWNNITDSFNWTNYDSCRELKQQEQEYRVYGCGVGECNYSVSQTKWENTTELRNKLQGCDNPILSYSFSESFGNIVFDDGGNFNGTIYGAMRILGRNGSAIYFNGNSLVNTNNNFSFNASDKFSISLWFKPDSITDNTERALISRSYPNYDYLIYQKGKRITFRIYMNNGANNIDAFFDLNDTKWHHLAGVYNGFDSLVYGDGVAMPLHYGNSTNSNFSVRSVPLLIGTGITWQGRTGAFKGAIDEFKIFNRNISIEEIVSLNNSVPAQYCGDGICSAEENYTNCFYDCVNTENYLSYYSFNETSVTIVADSSGNHNGTIVNGATRISGRSGNAIYFDGVNDYVNTGYTFPVSSSNKISISLWFKPDATTFSEEVCNGLTNGYSCKERAIVSRGYQIPATPYTLFQNGKLLKWAIYSNPYGFTAVSDISDLNDGKWHYVTAVFDGTEAILYIDGLRRSASVHLSGMTLASGTTNVAIGYGMTWQGRTGYFKGLIDEVKIYDRSLSPTEINSIYVSAPVSNYCGDGICNNGESYIGCACDCPREPILLYSFEDDGTAMNDSLNRSNGYISPTVKRILGKKGNALYFNGSSYAMSGSLNLSRQNQISVSMWVFNMSSGQALVIGANWFSTVQIIPQGSWTGFYVGNTLFGVNKNLNDGKWHHLVLTFNNGTSKGVAKAYIDGVPKITYQTSSKDLVVSSNEKLVLGKRWPWDNQFYRGGIDEVRVYNVTLSDIEVNQMFGVGI